jgi:lipid-A-disaccharide synthase
LPILLDAVERLRSLAKSAPHFILAVQPDTIAIGSNFRERISSASIQLLEGKTWDVLVCADVALAASGTVTIEACLLGTPMVTFYRVNQLSWWMGKALVRVPFCSMVNLVAGRKIVSEFIQDQMTPENLARETLALLENEAAREGMRRDLAEVADKLSGPDDPLEVAAALIENRLAEKQSKEEVVHVS